LGTDEKAKLSQKLSPQQKKTIEQKLWSIEDRRKEIEKQRWNIEDRINKILAEAETTNNLIKEKDEEAEAIRQKIKNTDNQIKLVRFAIEKGKLEEELIGNIEERESRLPLLEEATERKNSTMNRFEELAEKENSVNAELNAIEQQEKQAADPVQKRAAEQERWRVTGVLKSTTRAKWESDEKAKDAKTRLQSIQGEIDAISAIIDKIQSKIFNKEAALGKEGLPVGKIRDSISDLFKENDIKIDQELLKDIIQTDDRPQKPDPVLEEKIPAATTVQKISAPAEIKPVVAPKSTNEAPADDPAEIKPVVAPDTANFVPKNPIAENNSPEKQAGRNAIEEPVPDNSAPNDPLGIR
jgi:hypothetical protein